MRTNLNEITSDRLIEIMKHYDYSSSNHTLNIIIGSLHQSLFPEKYTKKTNTQFHEVNSNDHRSIENH